MREILFRGKRKDNGKWVYGFLVMNKCSKVENGRLICYTRPEIIPIGEIGEGDYDGDGNYYEYTVTPGTVGQYTGLTDKNGKKIFEGDICQHRSYYSDNIVISVVTYTDGHFLAMPDENSGFELSDKLEVIGNIHDTPELLKGGD